MPDDEQAPVEPEPLTPAGDARATQAALETAHVNPAADTIRATQGALENLYVRPNTVWATQICLEVAFPAYTPASRRNHSFVGVWMGTGHADNASFNF